MRRYSISNLSPLCSFWTSELISYRKSHKWSNFTNGRKSVFTISFSIILWFEYEWFSCFCWTGRHDSSTWFISIFREGHLAHIGVIFLEIPRIIPLYLVKSGIIEMVCQGFSWNYEILIIWIDILTLKYLILSEVWFWKPIKNISKCYMIIFMCFLWFEKISCCTPFTTDKSLSTLRRSIISRVKYFSFFLNFQSSIWWI